MPSVKIYSTPKCVYCDKAKEWFKENNIEYEEVNISADDAEREKLITKTGMMGVPVIEVGNEIIIGFDKVKLSKILNIEL